MTRVALRNASLRLLLAWLVLSIGGFWYARPIAQVLLPYFDLCLHVFNRDWQPMLAVAREHDNYSIHLVATARQSIPVTSTVAVEAGRTITTGVNVVHVLVPIVVFVSVLVAWPVRDLRARIRLLFFALPVLLLVVALTGPSVLAGKMLIPLQDLALAAGAHRPEPLLLTWMLFVEVGGSWLVALVAAIGCAALAQAVQERPARRIAPPSWDST